MKNIKKLIYFYLVFLLLAWLFLPFGVRAESFGTINLTNGQATVSSQIEVGKMYGFRFNVAEESDFLINNIDEIILYKIEDQGTEDISPSTEVTRVSATYTPSDAKQKFENSSIVILTNSSVRSIKIHALVKYHTNAGQAKTFTTNPNPYSVIATTVQPNGSTITPNLLTPNNGESTNGGNPPIVATNTASVGSITGYILGSTCGGDNIVSCYAQKIVRLLIIIASIGSIGMIIFGGIMLTTSGGDPKKNTTGRAAVTAAIIGLIITLLALSIQIFIQKVITGNEPSQIAINGGTSTNSGGSSSSDTITINDVVGSDSNEYNIVYKKSATAGSKIGSDQCLSFSNVEISIGGINILCNKISPGLLSADATKVIIDPNNGNADIYHDGIYDTWTATIAKVVQPTIPTGGGGSEVAELNRPTVWDFSNPPPNKNLDDRWVSKVILKDSVNAPPGDTVDRFQNYINDCNVIRKSFATFYSERVVASNSVDFEYDCGGNISQSGWQINNLQPWVAEGMPDPSGGGMLLAMPPQGMPAIYGMNISKDKVDIYYITDFEAKDNINDPPHNVNISIDTWTRTPGSEKEFTRNLNQSDLNYPGRQLKPGEKIINGCTGFNATYNRDSVAYWSFEKLRPFLYRQTKCNICKNLCHGSNETVNEQALSDNGEFLITDKDLYIWR